MIRLLYINDAQITYTKHDTAITIGNFDGFHRGHKRLIETINDLKKSSELKSLVMSFYPRPISVIKEIAVKSVFVEEERIEIAESLNVDILLEYPFTKAFAQLSGTEFVEVLKKQYNCKQIVVGEGFTFGKNRMWNAKSLAEIAKTFGINVNVTSHEQIDGCKISSTDIRKYLENGEVENANHLMGHDYFILAQVEQIGESSQNLRFSSVRIVLKEEKLLLKNGVYITKITLANGEVAPAITAVRENTMNNVSQRVVESYIPNVEADICNTKIKVEFKKFIRGELDFNSKKYFFKKIEEDIFRMNEYGQSFLD